MKLTIIIPTYNRKHHLRVLLYQITRFLSQYRNINVIIADNASSYNVKHEVDSYAIQWGSRLKLFSWEIGTGGFESNITKLIQTVHIDALGTHVWILGDDDLPTKQFLSTIRSFETRLEPNDILISQVGVNARTSNESMHITLHNTIDEYYDNLIANGKSQSSFGATFISSTVIPVQLFFQAFDSSQFNKAPSCLAYLSLFASMKDRYKYRVFSTSNAFVIGAFKPMMINISEEQVKKETVLQTNYAYEYIDVFFGNWSTISGCCYYFNQYSNKASEWFFYSQRCYFLYSWSNFTLNIPSDSLSSLPISLAIAIRYAIRFQDKFTIEDQAIISALKNLKLKRVDFTEGACIAFSPMIGWVKSEYLYER